MSSLVNIGSWFTLLSNTCSNSLPITEKASDEILSLPIHETLYDEEVQTAINCLCEIDQYEK